MARGGKRPGAARPKGRNNRAAAEQPPTLEALARAHTQTALEGLVNIAVNGASEASRVAACKAILDRAYGRPKQAHEHSGKNGAAPFAVTVTIGAEPSSGSSGPGREE